MDRSVRVADVLVELADTLAESFDPVDFAQTLAERCVELLAADASGVMLVDQRGELRLVAATMERARQLELFELQIDEGPCLDCFAAGRAITNVDLHRAAPSWPVFTPAAKAAGFRSTSALPMRLRGQVIGALNVFADQLPALRDSDLAIAQAMADVATIGLLQERTVHEKSALSRQLQTALDSRVLIEQAKGMLAALTGVPVAGAFDRMRRHARRNGTPLTSVAAAVLDGSLDARTLVDA